MTLPPPREPDGPYRIAMVCLGNICRSPMAEVILTAKLADGPLAGRVVVDSSGTGDWHVGDRMDERSATTLSAAGYDPSRHRAQQFERNWFADHDLVIAMDRSNLANISRLARDSDDHARVRLLRDFDSEAAGELDVPDPWYGGQRGFDEVLAIVERSTDALLDELESAVVRG